MAKSRLLISGFVILALCQAVFGAGSSAGTASFAFLKLQNSVRAAGMADTFVAVADDASAAVLNPAGLGRLVQREIQIDHNIWLADTSYSHVVYAHPLGDFGDVGVIGASLTYLNFGEMMETTRESQAGTARKFGSSGLEYSLSYGYLLSHDFSVGVGVKGVQQNLDQSTTSGVAYDVGVLWDLPWPETKFGGTFRNLGNSLPTETCLGLSSLLLKKQLLVGGEVVLPADNVALLRFGLEYKFTPVMALRAGFNTRSEEKAGGNWSLGLGLDLTSFRVDYAYVPYEELGSSHRIALGFDL
ncbi:MAG: PorV/PorQ family protein [bacterium]